MERVSSAENPELATSLAQSMLGDGGTKKPEEAVTIARPPDCSVHLPGGLSTPEGIIQDAEVRELTGADEEALSKADVMRNGGRYMQVLLKRAVVRIGDYEPPTKDQLAALLVGDRNMLLLAIRKATYGSKIEVSIACPGCAETLDIEFDLDKDVPIHTLEDPTKRVYEVELRHGRIAKVTLPCGGDQDFVIGDGKRTVPEMNTIMLSRCVQTIDDEVVMGTDAVRGLGIVDRRTILAFIAKTQPGPKYEEVKEECPACSREVPVPLDLFDLFLG